MEGEVIGPGPYRATKLVSLVKAVNFTVDVAWC